MRKYNIPRARFNSSPFVDGFVGIEKTNQDLTIGNSERFVDLFWDDNPEYIKLLCTISSKKEFGDVTISARYKEKEDEEIKVMSYKLYDGSKLNMKGAVSEISVEFLDVIPEFGSIKKSWKDFLIQTKVIYKKEFQTQKVSKNIENFPDGETEVSSFIHTKTKAHFFGGSYNTGIKLSNIQQYLFFMGTGLQAEPYIGVISAHDVFQSGKIKLDPGITKESLSTLEDDISNGKISITFPDAIVYKSIFVSKTTLVSDIFQILLKRQGEQNG